MTRLEQKTRKAADMISPMEKVGVFVVVVLAAAVAYVLHKAKAGSTNGEAVATPVTAALGVVVRPVIFAAVVKATDALAAGQEAKRAAGLFANASMRWAGSAEEWEELQRDMNLPTLAFCPDNANKDVVMAFVGAISGTVPANRLAIRAKLAELATNETLKFVGLYDRPASLNPKQFGFQIG